MPLIKEFKFKVINPNKPKFLVPSMFDLFLFIGWIFYIAMSIINSNSGNLDSIFLKISFVYFKILDVSTILGFLAFAFTIFIPLKHFSIVPLYLVFFYTKSKIEISIKDY